MSGFTRSALAVLLLARCASAVPVASNLAPGSSGSPLFWGQSFTVLAAGPVNNVVINFFLNTPPTVPLAAGTGFLLSSQYLGTPAALSGATPGFLGSAAAVANRWTFNPALTLSANTQYFFYSNAAMTPIGGGNPYAGGDGFLSNPAGANFAPFGQDLAFLVDATLAPVVPEIDAHAAAPAFAAIFCMLSLLGSATFGRPARADIKG